MQPKCLPASLQGSPSSTVLDERDGLFYLVATLPLTVSALPGFLLKTTGLWASLHVNLLYSASLPGKRLFLSVLYSCIPHRFLNQRPLCIQTFSNGFQGMERKYNIAWNRVTLEMEKQKLIIVLLLRVLNTWDVFQAPYLVRDTFSFLLVTSQMNLWHPNVLFIFYAWLIQLFTTPFPSPNQFIDPFFFFLPKAYERALLKDMAFAEASTFSYTNNQWKL